MLYLNQARFWVWIFRFTMVGIGFAFTLIICQTVTDVVLESVAEKDASIKI